MDSFAGTPRDGHASDSGRGGSFEGDICSYCQEPWGTGRGCFMCGAFLVRRAQHERLRSRVNGRRSESVQDRLKRALGRIELHRPRSLKASLVRCQLGIRDLEPLLVEAGPFPYGRHLLYQNQGIESLVMNWPSGAECAPHDHGSSWGWVHILEGEAEHSVYQLDVRGVPRVRRKRLVRAGGWLFAPKGLIHSMGNPTSNRLVTLHVYVPCITGMRVYDPSRCASCVVRDDCGAWWPADDRQIVQISPPSSAGDLPR